MGSTIDLVRIRFSQYFIYYVNGTFRKWNIFIFILFLRKSTLPTPLFQLLNYIILMKGRIFNVMFLASFFRQFLHYQFNNQFMRIRDFLIFLIFFQPFNQTFNFSSFLNFFLLKIFTNIHPNKNIYSVIKTYYCVNRKYSVDTSVAAHEPNHIKYSPTCKFIYKYK